MNYTPGPLPEAAGHIDRGTPYVGDQEPGARYTSDQMRAHTASEVARAVAAERERCARVCDDEARIREEAGNTWPEESPERSRCFAGARAAMNCAKGVRSGEVV